MSTNITDSLNKLKTLLSELDNGECAYISISDCPISPTPTNTVTQTPGPTPSITSTATVTPSITPTSTVTPSITPTVTTTPTPTVSITKSGCPNKWVICPDFPEPLLADSLNDCGCPPSTPASTPTVTPTNTPVPILPTATPTITRTSTPTITPTVSVTQTNTVTPTVTSTTTPTKTPTPTLTRTNTVTPTVTSTATPTKTPTPTLTPTRTSTQTPTPSVTVTKTQTPTISITPTLSLTATITPTPSLPANTPTITPTLSVTPTISPSAPANKFNGVNARGLALWNGQESNVTSVGSNGGPSYYDTYDQSGNCWEWNDGIYSDRRCIRGGSFEAAANKLGSDNRAGPTPLTNTLDVDKFYIGFRIATINNSLDLSDMASVGNINNIFDYTGYGSVTYAYKISRFKITNTQYAEFLNAIASTDTFFVYNIAMNTDIRCGISRSGSPGSYSYSVKTNMGNKPVVRVTWLNAARYINWLSNNRPSGLQSSSTTENGTYPMINGVTVLTMNSIRKNIINPNTNRPISYWIPTENEWYKSAYYDPNRYGQNLGGYWRYATQTDNIPCSVSADSIGNGSTNCLITPTPTPSITSSKTPTPTPTISRTPAATTTPSKTPTRTPTKPAPSVTPSVTPTNTPAPTPPSEFTFAANAFSSRIDLDKSTEISILHASSTSLLVKNFNHDSTNTDIYNKSNIEVIRASDLQYRKEILSRSISTPNTGQSKENKLSIGQISKMLIDPNNSNIGFVVENMTVYTINLLNNTIIKKITLQSPTDPTIFYRNPFTGVLLGAPIAVSKTGVGVKELLDITIYDNKLVIYAEVETSFSNGTLITRGRYQVATLFYDIFSARFSSASDTTDYSISPINNRISYFFPRIEFVGGYNQIYTTFDPDTNKLIADGSLVLVHPKVQSRTDDYESVYYLTKSVSGNEYSMSTELGPYSANNPIIPSNKINRYNNYIFINNSGYASRQSEIVIMDSLSYNYLGSIALSYKGLIVDSVMSKIRPILFVAQVINSKTSVIYTINTDTNTIVSTYLMNNSLPIHSLQCYNDQIFAVFVDKSNEISQIKIQKLEFIFNTNNIRLLANMNAPIINRNYKFSIYPGQDVGPLITSNIIVRNLQNASTCFIVNGGSTSLLNLVNSNIISQIDNSPINPFEIVDIKTNVTQQQKLYCLVPFEVAPVYGVASAAYRYNRKNCKIYEIKSSLVDGPPTYITRGTDAALNLDGTLLYVRKISYSPDANFPRNMIDIYRTSDNTIITTINMPNVIIPRGIQNSVGKLCIDDFQRPDTGHCGFNICVYPDSSKILVSTITTLNTVNLSTLQTEASFSSLPSDLTLGKIFINYNSTKAYILSTTAPELYIVDLINRRLTQRVKLTAIPKDLAFNLYGNLFVLLYNGTITKINGINNLSMGDLPYKADSISTHPSNNILYMMLMNPLTRFNGLDHTLLKDNRIVGHTYYA